LSSVNGQPFLSKEEFFIYIKYIGLAQSGYGITYESFKSNFAKAGVPRFEGIAPPPIKQPSFNPFDEEEEEDEDEGFHEFVGAAQS